MNVKTVVPLSAALVLGLAASAIALRMMKEAPAAVKPDGQPAVDMVQVIVAARDIDPGAKIDPGKDLRIARFERSAASDLMYGPEKGGMLPGRVARVSIRKGQPVIDAMLAPQGAQAGLQGVIRPGMRAITITVEEGIATFLDPGNIVDVVGKLPAEPGQTGPTLSTTVVQGIEVLAVGNRLTTDRPEAKPGDAPPPAPSKAVTLLVTPEQAERIDLTATQGTPRLVMRSPTDQEQVVVRGGRSVTDALAALAALRSPSTKPSVRGPFDNEADFPRVKAGPKTRQIQVIRGGVATVVEVPVEPGAIVPTATAAPTPAAQPQAKPDPSAMTGGADLGQAAH
ncbi:MAG: Flp pilus assembly protein CpaB [Tepidisphaeraceae bacterium]